MKKILELTAKNFLTGLAPSDSVQNMGLWYSALGLNPFIGGQINGSISISGTPTDIGGTDVTDTPIAYAVDASDASTNYMYVLGSSGRFYVINMSTNAVTVLRSGASVITDPTAGMFIFQAKNGTKYLYYVQKTQIGRWSMATKTSYQSAEWDDDYITGLTSSDHHPCHVMFDEVYIGNTNKLAQLKDDGAGSVTFSANILDNEAKFTVTAINDDGYYLAYAVTTNGGSSTDLGQNYVRFWDKVSSSWNDEQRIIDITITALRRSAGVLYAFSQRAIHQLAYRTQPVKLRSFATDYGVNYKRVCAADVWNDGVLFGNKLLSFGKIYPGAPTAFFTPFTGHSGDVTMVAASAKFPYIYVGTAGNKLYTYNYATASYSNSAQSTIFMDIGRKWRIVGYRASFESFNANGSFQVTFQSRSTNISTPSIASTDLDGGYSVFRNVRQGALETDTLQIQLILAGGAIQLSRFEVYGEPMDMQ